MSITNVEHDAAQTFTQPVALYGLHRLGDVHSLISSHMVPLPLYPMLHVQKYDPAPTITSHDPLSQLQTNRVGARGVARAVVHFTGRGAGALVDIHAALRPFSVAKVACVSQSHGAPTHSAHRTLNARARVAANRVVAHSQQRSAVAIVVRTFVCEP